MTPFHGLATPSGGRRAVENDDVLPPTPVTGMKIGPVESPDSPPYKVMGERCKLIQQQPKSNLMHFIRKM